MTCTDYSTHHTGCDCHEAGWQRRLDEALARVRDLERQRDSSDEALVDAVATRAEWRRRAEAAEARVRELEGGRPMTPRIVALMGGGDWYDASVDLVVVLADVSLPAEKEQYERWLRDEYTPALHRKENPLYMDFGEWLRARCGARDAHEVEEFWEP